MSYTIVHGRQGQKRSLTSTPATQGQVRSNSWESREPDWNCISECKHKIYHRVYESVSQVQGPGSTNYFVHTLLRCRLEFNRFTVSVLDEISPTQLQSVAKTQARKGDFRLKWLWCDARKGGYAPPSHGLSDLEGIMCSGLSLNRELSGLELYLQVS